MPSMHRKISSLLISKKYDNTIFPNKCIEFLAEKYYFYLYHFLGNYREKKILSQTSFLTIQNTDYPQYKFFSAISISHCVIGNFEKKSREDSYK